VKSRLATVLVAASVLAGMFTTAPFAGAVGRPVTVATPCGSPAAAPHYTHVVWIMFENVGYGVVGSSSAPYFNQLAARCALATNDHAVAHPSLPNYVALTSGSTQGISDDAEPSVHPLQVPSIFSQLHGNWRTYAESMPSSCDRITSGSYAARHNPAVYYVGLSAACRSDDVAMTSSLSLGSAFTMIVPNICDDMHSCSVSVGDQWLRRTMPTILRSVQYRTGSTVVFVTFDENDSDSTNRIPTIVIAPSVHVGARVGTSFTHYSLLSTTESLLGLAHLGAARSAHSMIGPFHL
jgi:hypothetical protein